METSAQIKADALREQIKSLNAVIAKIRALHDAGKEAPKASARYIEYIRAAHELAEQASAAGVVGSLVEPMSPIPFRDQLVGYSAEERRRLEWKAPRVQYPFAVATPVITKIAA